MNKIAVVLSVLIFCVCAGALSTAYAIKAAGDTSELNTYSSKVSVSDFDAIDASLSIDVYYTPGAKKPVSISAEERVLPYVKVSVSGRTLELTMDKKYANDNTGKIRRKNDKIKIYVTAPEVKSFDASTSATIICDGELNGIDKLTAVASTSGDVKLGRVNASSAKIDASTSGDVRIDALVLSGNADMDASTSGDVVIGKLVASAVTANASTSGDVTVKDANVKSLNADCSTSGDVSVSGRGSCLNVECSTGGDFNGRNFQVEDATAGASLGSEAKVNAVRCNSRTSLGGSVSNHK